MEIELNKIIQKFQNNNFIKDFVEELTKALNNSNNKNKQNDENLKNIKLSQEEDLELYRKETDFLQEYFKKELSDLSKGEIFIVTNKYEADIENCRYKIGQYKDNKQCLQIVFENDLPKNIQLDDIVRKIDGKYIYDEEATKYVKDIRNKIRQEIIDKRN